MSLSIETLKQKLGECKQLECKNCLTKSSFEIVTKKEFFVLDDKRNENPVRIVDKHSDYQLIVSNRNKNANEVCLVKTDKCLFTDAHKKCDCILFNTDRVYFVEISEANKKNNKRNDAVEQLGAIIQLFIDSGIDFSDMDSKAIICFKRGNTKPVLTSLLTKRAIFFEKYKVPLEEVNKISFDAKN